ncbi:FAD-dependent oxidoreductase [Bacillus sp. V3B]|uniref:FAD-dependent oxidoreductase n=1 Tax=Bacillus sp. V3B TaxID=2804915 RepID=UPI002108C3C9|nr:FAD-dependent oxidoreductase [Bacillus sp. V3B]MCQ6274515.1 FAD-dependent oxidoreductase [Bacillus sp. V3B]
MADKKIVIIGAGYAGVHAAKKLAKKYKKDESVSITLIDRHSYHTMMTELHEVAAHRVEPTDIQFDLRRLFNRTKVNLVTDNVTNVDNEEKVVITEHGSYSYDYLILGMGGEPNDFGTPGVKENGFTLWSWEDAVKLREHIEKTVHRASGTHDEAKRRAMLTFAVCGSGFTGIEMVGELIEWKIRLAKNNKIDADDITLYVIEAAPTILNTLERKDADKAEAYLVKQGVKILKDSPITEVKADSIVLKSGEEIETHTLIWTAGVKANSDTEDYGIPTARAGRLKVNEYMEAEGFEDTYVIGDLAYFEEDGKPTPQIVEAAEQTGSTAATSIIAEISGGEKKAFSGKYHGTLVSIGARYGVANLGGVSLSGWFANFMKHIVNIYYFLTISSGYYIVQYLKHEIFHTRDKRNIFRDVTSRYGNVLWSFPLRLLVGWFWIDEAGAKIWGETKWGARDLNSGLGDDSWVVSDSVKMPFEWLQTATSSATPAAEATTEIAPPILDSMPGWFEAIMKLMMPTPEVAVMMQQMVPWVELILGVGILLGLFTWLFNLISVSMLAMFTLSAMLGWDKFWALPASIALMNGSGRFLGLDYYVLPALGKSLGNWWYGKERAIYKDKK